MLDTSLMQLMWLASPALPVGGFSYSEGLEAAVDAQYAASEADAKAWLLHQLHIALARSDLPVVALAAPGDPALDRGVTEALAVADVVILAGHGLLTVGKTIADAFLAMYTFENTCRIQVDALSGQAGPQGLTAVDPGILDGVAHASRVQTGGLGGAFVWPSLLRKLQRESPDYAF